MVSSDQANATSNHKYSIRLTCHFKVFISKKLATEFFVAQNMSAYVGSHFNIQNVKNSMSWNNTASRDAAGHSEQGITSFYPETSLNILLVFIPVFQQSCNKPCKGV